MEFVDGLNADEPSDKAPDFIKAKLSIKCRVLSEWLSERPEQWLNLDIREAKSGKWYVCINDFKPGERVSENQTPPTDYEDSPPF